jgi:hypothetical protein
MKTSVCEVLHIDVYLSANGAPPCRTTHARDAAGAASNLGAIHPGPLCLQFYRFRRLPAARVMFPFGGLNRILRVAPRFTGLQTGVFGGSGSFALPDFASIGQGSGYVCVRPHAPYRDNHIVRV